MRNIDAVLNKTVQLECSVHGTPTPEINWYHEDQKIFSGLQSQGNIFEILNNNTLLKISNIRLKQEGRYACIAINKVGKAEANIFVQIIGLFNN